MKRIFDPEFRYTPSYGTDLRKTFARIRLERDAGRVEGVPPRREGGDNIVRLDPRKAASA